jgi:hypothetical protein
MSHSTGSRAGIDVVLSVSEFPDWLSPIFVRDLRQGLRASFFVWAFVLLQSLALVAAMAEWAMAQLFSASGPIFAGAFPVVTALIFGFFLPFSLFNSLQPELGRGRNAELLLTSRLTRWQIVRGKLLVATTLSALLLVSLFPYFLIRYFLGGVELIGLIAEMLNLLVANAAMSAIVIGASAFSSHIVRFVVIFLLMSFHSMTAAAYAIRSSITGLRTSFFILDAFAGQTLASILFVILCLQLGRAKLQTSRHVIDTAAKVMVFIFLTPIAHGIIVATGGPLPAILLLCLMLAGALLFDRDRPVKKELKLSPEQPPY